MDGARPYRALRRGRSVRPPDEHEAAPVDRIPIWLGAVGGAPVPQPQARLSQRGGGGDAPAARSEPQIVEAAEQQVRGAIVDRPQAHQHRARARLEERHAEAEVALVARAHPEGAATRGETDEPGA